MGSPFKPGVPISHRDQLPASSKYELLLRIASGGMATVYVGRVSGAAGFRRLVAIKRAHAHLLEDPQFTRMLISESRLASRIHHPNAIAVQNVEELEGELLLVMDYVEGASLSALLLGAEEAGKSLTPKVAVRIALDACAGLQAAHELTDEEGVVLKLVHRDVSPQNLMVGVDGSTRLTDFGIAKCMQGGPSVVGTTTGALKGKVGYMAPEYIESGQMDARGDVFSLGIVLWEALTSARLFRRGNDLDTLKAVIGSRIPAPSSMVPQLSPLIDGVVLRALQRAPQRRYATARAFAEDLESAAIESGLMGSHTLVATLARELLGDMLDLRRAMIRDATQGAVSRPDSIDEFGGSGRRVAVSMPIADADAPESFRDKSQPITMPLEASERLTVPMPTPYPASRQPSGPVSAASGILDAGDSVTGTIGSGITKPPQTSLLPTSHAGVRIVRGVGLALALGVLGGIGVISVRGLGARPADSSTSQPPLSDSARGVSSANPLSPGSSTAADVGNSAPSASVPVVGSGAPSSGAPVLPAVTGRRLSSKSSPVTGRSIPTAGPSPVQTDRVPPNPYDKH